jgi:hypothetical protein
MITFDYLLGTCALLGLMGLMLEALPLSARDDPLP